VEKSDVRRNDPSPRRPVRELVGFGSGEEQGHPYRFQGTALPSLSDLFRRQPGSVPVGECCYHFFSRLINKKKYPE